MTETRANSGLDLHLEVSRTRPAASLESALRSAIRSGRLAPGQRLPASRSLALDLGVARNSVAEAYGRLVAEGWLEARVGAGTWVGDREHAPEQQPAVRPDSAALLDLRGGIPDATTFPRSAWAAAARQALTRAPSEAFGYGSGQGAPSLRSTLAEYVSRARGVFAEPADVVVTHGFGELLALTARALVGRGARRIAVEEYGHESHRAILRASGLRLIGIPVDRDGAAIDALETSGADAVLLTPAHQFPTGVPLSPTRRVDVVRWAERTGGLIVEDDYDGEFRYDRRSIGALQALAPQHVLFAGTASKSLAPAVGLAWGVVPHALLPAVLEQQALAGGAPATLTQLTLAEFIDRHRYDRHLRSLRGRYRARREELELAVGAGLSEARVSGMAAGLHCLVELPPGTDEAAVTRRALSLGLQLDGLSTFHVGGQSPGRGPAMVLGIGGPADQVYSEAVAAALEAMQVAMHDAAGA
ncbi:PLP-dependent aminotransferase family protein [Glaciibacter flavus]|uniref:MocR-like pyridoxine biosynthesis transcription factor PdxR n=1 Tax=Orlajensenia flava TaxID=2565934 RepID=UPI003B009767